MSAATAELYQANRDFLWGLCYRMTGSAADAEDVVQETFVRVIERPPRRLQEPLRPWLVRVAINLSRDLLRRRRRANYTGPWLPSPIPTDDHNPPSFEPMASPEDSPMARYDMLESVSFAFLLALEALTPAQRAVLLLRDVFDYSTDEAAEALDMSAANVKVTLHRARRAMREYDKNRSRITAERKQMTRKALEQFLMYLQASDVAGLARLLADDVVELSDGGGEVYAALAPIRGRDKVLRLIFGLAKKIGPLPAPVFRELNGVPALVFEGPDREPRHASRFSIQCEVDAAGRIRTLMNVLAPRKLSALWPNH
ncbi:MAG TPA: sigma-70 family RNA polymerase sigma factor [Blastocatellia bacterium]|nr:sigma-70 family RNA polymerase sigma factor [Blastocatellia bacterium]